MVSVFNAVRDLVRLREITQVLVRHGFGEIVTRAGFGRKSPAGKKVTKGESTRPPRSADEGPADEPEELDEEDVVLGEAARKSQATAERIRLVLQDLGPSFIKLGQIASTRGDVIPAEIIAELKKLQDEVPPVPFEDIKRQVEGCLNVPLHKLYASFDETPLATASIGQVHRARIWAADGVSPGDHVVVKVQRPGVAPIVARDLELLHIMAAAIERAIPESKLYSPVALVQQFDTSITAELNFLTEAENGARLTENFKGDPQIRFPRVYRELTSKHVLTQEFFDGRKIDKALKTGFDGRIIAKQSVRIVIKMVFEDGFFHADPHPGNIIILGTPEAPVLGLIDIGMVGRLSPELRDATVSLMIAAARKDSYAVADALYAIGRPTRKVDMRAYRAEVAVLAEKYLGKPLKEIELSAMLRDLVQGALKFGIEIPTDFMMVGKALMTLEGIGKQLDPDLDIYGESQPYFLEILKKRYSPERLGNELWRGVEQLSKVGYDMPLQVREVLDDLRLGRLSMKTEVTAPLPDVERAGKRLFAGLTFASLAMAGAYLLGQHMHIAAGVFFALAVVTWVGDLVRLK